MKRLLIVAAAVAVLGLAVVTIGGAVTSAQEGDGPIGSFLSKVADKLGVTQDELKVAIEEARDETIGEAVTEGRLTEEQAERLREGGFPFNRRLHRAGGHILVAAADVLEMEKDDLVAELREGNSLADVAAAQGIGVDGFKAQLLAEVQADIDAKVADGTITQEQADRLSEGLEERIDNIVNAQPGEGGFGGPSHRLGGFGGSWHVPLDEAEEASEVTA
jgi:polyhydroxyalkanoate synthesis regulator phasin